MEDRLNILYSVGTQVYKIERPVVEISELSSSSSATGDTTGVSADIAMTGTKRKTEDLTSHPSANTLPVVLFPNRELSENVTTANANPPQIALNSAEIVFNSIKMAETTNSTQVVPTDVTNALFTANRTLMQSKKLTCIGTMLLHIDSAQKIFKFEFIQVSAML